MENLKKILFLLTPKERRRAVLLLIMILVMALLDMIGVASILPFMAVLTNPSIIDTNIILNQAFDASQIFGVQTNEEFLFVLGILVFALLIFSLAFKALTTYAQIRFIQMRQYSLSKRLVEGYLNQPYSWFLNRHSADLGKTILSEAGEVVGIGMAPLIELIAKGTVTIALLTLLIIVDPKLTLIVGLTLALIYVLIYYFIRSYLNKIGKERVESNQSRFTSVSEAFGAAKEVKVGGLEQTYVGRFSVPAQTFARTTASSKVLRQIPRYFLEATAFGGILLLILYLMNQSGSFDNALPIISLYVFAGYRLMPALQQIYASFTQLTFVGPALNKIHQDMKNLEKFPPNKNQTNLSLNSSIVLENIHYNYPNVSKTALKNINLKISPKTTIGFVGVTGSGKTTVVDIILGLLQPQKGFLKVDEQIISKENVRSWQKSIGYVPQHIYLSDDTVAANIAFGVKSKDIDLDNVESVAKVANLHEFVVNDLPEKYQTTIGERGIRLSGGQRQRIGIARALYHSPQVLILDEATSALDNITEKVVMDAVNNLRKNITIIIIAHRLNTIKKCDKIFLLEKGELKNQGTFEELIKVDDNFRVTANN